jgi:type I restriction enzyme S subunit
MNAERLLAHYERIADAPDAIPRLRRFVLDLAVRGKLVPQDPDDEPAAELLKRIAAEKARRVKAGDLRKPRDLDNGGAIDEPFSIPATWRWLRLDAVGAIVGGGTPSATDPDNFAEPGEGVPWLTPADLGGYSDLYISRGARDLSEKGLRTSSATVMPKGTVLFTSRAPIGYVAIAANPISTNQGFKSIVSYVADCSRFIATAMKAFAADIDAKAPGTTFKEVSGKIVAAIPFPLPPLPEQHRIVAKVHELMALCDRLEAARAQREATRDRLMAASLTRIKACDPNTFRDDASFALDALPALTCAPRSDQAVAPDYPQPRRPRQARAARPERRAGVAHTVHVAGRSG